MRKSFIILILIVLLLPVLLVKIKTSSCRDFLQYKNAEYNIPAQKNIINKKFPGLLENIYLLQKRIEHNWNPPSSNNLAILKVTTSKNHSNKEPNINISDKTDLEYSRNISDKQFYKSVERAARVSFNDILPYNVGYDVQFKYNNSLHKKIVGITKIDYFAHNEFFEKIFTISMSIVFPIFLIPFIIYIPTIKQREKTFKTKFLKSNEIFVASYCKNLIRLLPLTLISSLIAGFIITMFLIEDRYVIRPESLNFLIFYLLAMILPTTLFYYIYNSFLILTDKRVVDMTGNELKKEVLLEDIYKVEAEPVFSIISGQNGIKFRALSNPYEAKQKIEEYMGLKSSHSVTDYKENDKSIDDTGQASVKYCRFCATEVPVNTITCPLCDSRFPR